MKFYVKKSEINGTIEIPGSKSHTIRGIALASLAEGKSTLIKPLISQDALAARRVYSQFGAQIDETPDKMTIKGFAGHPPVPSDIIDVANSGTTLRLALATAGLVPGYSIFTGDNQIKSRPQKNLLSSLSDLGASYISPLQNDKCPLIIKGITQGGITTIEAVTSQYLSALLLHAPLLTHDTTIHVPLLNERPYVDITLWWMDKLGIRYSNQNYSTFFIPANQHYPAFNLQIPGDFSSATFFAVLAAISGGSITLSNLDTTDPQGDKEVITILETMGAKVSFNDSQITVTGNKLKGMEIDMNAIPDALPAMAVAACFSEGTTTLRNVPQARLKETDRIAVMYQELSKMGALIRELEDGLEISSSSLKGAEVHGHHDHRIVMALAVAGLVSPGTTVIDTAEAAGVTLPEFPELVTACGGKLEIKD